MQQPEAEAAEPANVEPGSRILLAAGAGAVSATAVSWALSLASPTLHRTAATAFVLALAFVLLACAGGALGPWAVLRASPADSARALAMAGMRGWMFIPAALLLLAQRSPLALFAAAAAAGFAAGQYKGRQQPALTFSKPSSAPMLLLLPDLPKRPVWLAALAASCLTLIVPVWLTHRLNLAAASCAAAAALLGHLKSTSQPASQAKQNVLGLFQAALLVTFFALLPALRGGLAAGGERAAVSLADLLASRIKAAPRPSQSSGAGFQGIILWPFPDRSKVLPPAPQRASAAPSPRRPLVIPFRGPYLYFKPWMRSPGPLAHIARGSPLQVSVRASGGDLLRMGAQQDLAAPVLLSCCRAIEVSLDDQEPGQAGVTVGLILTDTTAPGNPAQDLGLQRVEAGAPQSSAVLRFLLPRPARITRFTRLTVLLFPSPQHESQGRRVAVEQFAFIPR